MFAISIAGEYSQGTLRNLLVRQPRRVRLLAGKLLALAGFTTIAIVAAEVVAVATAFALAPSQDVATTAWFTSAGWAALGTGFANLLLATLGWGLLGALLALLLRSPAPAVGVGLAYAIPFEELVTAAWSSGERWLPGQLLGVLADGGTATVTYPAPRLRWRSTGCWPSLPAQPCSPAATSPPDHCAALIGQVGLRQWDVPPSPRRGLAHASPLG